jgi:hypothetical protein
MSDLWPLYVSKSCKLELGYLKYIKTFATDSYVLF